jgi:hypothetical protein
MRQNIEMKRKTDLQMGNEIRGWEFYHMQLWGIINKYLNVKTWVKNCSQNEMPQGKTMRCKSAAPRLISPIFLRNHLLFFLLNLIFNRTGFWTTPNLYQLSGSYTGWFSPLLNYRPCRQWIVRIFYLWSIRVTIYFCSVRTVILRSSLSTTKFVINFDDIDVNAVRMLYVISESIKPCLSFPWCLLILVLRITWTSYTFSLFHLASHVASHLTSYLASHLASHLPSHLPSLYCLAIWFRCEMVSSYDSSLFSYF